LDTRIADIVRLIEVEDLHDVVLVGHSYGGLPVSTAALRVRERVKTVVYVDSGPHWPMLSDPKALTAALAEM
jgi:pimeloyl-ACP methyl ester carboxylesterase